MATRDDIARRFAAGREAIAPEGLAARIVAARSLKKVIKWPGTDIDVSIQVLSRRDLAESQAASIQALKHRGIDELKPAAGHVEQIGAEYVLQILSRALYEPDGSKRLFASVEDFASVVTEAELYQLSAVYTDLLIDTDPSPEDLPDDKYDEFVEAAKKKGPMHLSAIVSSMPKSWLPTLAVRLATSLGSSFSNTESSES